VKQKNALECLLVEWQDCGKDSNQTVIITRNALHMFHDPEKDFINFNQT
jgi:hypothetical protein